MSKIKSVSYIFMIYFLVFNLIFSPVIVSAGGLTADPSANVKNRPNIDQAQNGLPVVNLAAPSAKGVSHNKFSSYNVEKKGLILNNSKKMATSLLGGTLYGNPNYQNSREASIVLNEVTGAGRSFLKGYTEMHGRAAQLVVANPNGITCDGCGFINTPKVTLGTGVPVLDSAGGLKGLSVQGGDVAVEGLGLDASQVDYFDIVTRAAKINAGIWAGDELAVHIGTGNYDYAAKQFGQGASSSGSKPEFGIDASALGSMYAGRITLVGTEKGVGVRSETSALHADSGDIVITADGSIVLKDAHAKKNIRLTSSDDIVQSGESRADNTARYKAGGRVALKSGRIDARNVIEIESRQLDLEDADVMAGTRDETHTAADIRISAGRINIDSSSTVAARNSVEISLADTVENHGRIKSFANLDINTATFNNSGDMAGSDTVNVNASEIINTGSLFADNLFNITAGSFTNEGGRLISDNDIRILLTGGLENRQASLISAYNTLAVTAAEIKNNASNIEAGNNVSIASKTLSNSSLAEIRTDGILFMDVEKTITNDNSSIFTTAATVSGTAKEVLTLSAGTMNNQNTGIIRSGGDTSITTGAIKNLSGSSLASGGALDVAAQSFNSSGTIFSSGDLYIDVTQSHGAFTNTGYIGSEKALAVNVADLFSNTGTIESVQDMAIRSDTGQIVSFTNTGLISSWKNLVVEAGTITNKDNNRMNGEGLATGGLIAGNSLSLESEVLNNTNGRLESFGSLEINTGSLFTSGHLAGRTATRLTASEITNSGDMLSGESLSISSGSFANTGGKVVSDRDININLTGGMKNMQSSIISAYYNLAVNAGGNSVINEAATMEAGGSLKITSGSLVNRALAVIQSNGTLFIDAANNVLNDNSTFQALKQTGLADLDIRTLTFTNRNNSSVWANGSTDITAAGVINQTGASLGSVVKTTVASDNITNSSEIYSQGSAEITASQNIINSGSIQSGGEMTATAGVLNNTSGLLFGQTGLDIGGEKLTNQNGEIKSGGNIVVNSALFDNTNGFVLTTNRLSALKTINIDGIIEAGSNIDIDARNTAFNNNRGIVRLFGSGSLYIRDLASIDNSGGAILSSDRLEFAVNGDYTLDGSLYAQNSFKVSATNIYNAVDIAMNGDIRINAGENFENKAGKKMVTNNLLEIITGSEVDNKGELSGQGIDIQSGTTVSNSHLITGGDGTTSIHAVGNITNADAGRISSAGDMELTGTFLDNYGLINTGKTLTGNFSTIANHPGKLILSGTDMTLNVSGTIKNLQGNLYAQGAMTLQKSPGVKNTKVLNDRGTIESAGNMAIYTKLLENTGSSSGSYSLKRVDYEDVPDEAYAEQSDSYWRGDREWNWNFHYHNGFEYQIDYLRWNEGNYSSLNNYHFIPSNRFMPTLIAEKAVVSNIEVTPAYIISGSDMQIISDKVTNTDSIITAGKDIVITASTLNNHSTTQSTELDNKLYRKLVGFYNKHFATGGGREGDQPMQKEYPVYKIWWESGTATVGSGSGTLIQSGGGLTVNAQQIGNQAVDTSSGSRAVTQRSSNIVFNTASLQNVKNTGTIEVLGPDQLPGSNNALFTIDKSEGDSQRSDTLGFSLENQTALALTQKQTTEENSENDSSLSGAYNTGPAREKKFSYLVETRPELVSVDNLKGSEYLLDRIGFAPDSDITLLGDAFYEQKMISQAIQKTTSRLYLSDHLKSEAEQLEWLITNAASASKNLNLSVGSTLSKTQIDSLSQPIVWLVEKQVEGRTVLAPQIYIPAHVIEGFRPETSVISGNSVAMVSSGNIVNTGDIASESDLYLAAETIENMSLGSQASLSAKGRMMIEAENSITNQGGWINADGAISLTALKGDIISDTRTITEKWSNGNIATTLDYEATISGNSLLVHAGRDIINQGSAMASAESAVLTAGRDIQLEALTLENQTMSRNRRQRIITETTGLQGASLDAGSLTMAAGRDIVSRASDIRSQGGTSLTAGNDIFFETVGLKRRVDKRFHNGYSLLEAETRHGSVLESGNDLVMDASRDISIAAGSIDSEGHALITAGRDFGLFNDYDTSYFKSYSESSGFFSSESTTRVRQSATVTDATLNAQNALVSAGRDLTITGAKPSIVNDLSLDAGNDISILAARDQYYSKTVTQESGFFKGGGLWGSERSLEISRKSLVHGSLVDVTGDFISKSGTDTLISGSTLNTGNARFDAGQDFIVAADQDETYSLSIRQKTGFNALGLLNIISPVDLGPVYTQTENENETRNTRVISSAINATGSIAATAGSAMIIGSNLDADDDIHIQSDTGSIDVVIAQELFNARTLDKKIEVSLPSLLDLATDFIGQTTGMLESSINTDSTQSSKLKLRIASAEYNKTKTTAQRVTNVSSSLTSGNGNIILDSGRDILVEGSDIESGGSVSLTADKGNVTIREALDTYISETDQKTVEAAVYATVQNEYAEAAIAAKNVAAATEQLKDAKESYENYKDEVKNQEASLARLKEAYQNKVPGIDPDDIDELAELISDLKGDEKYYVAGIAAATANLASRTTIAMQQIAAAGSSTGTWGFSAGLSLDMEGSKTNTNETATTAVASKITGNNIYIQTGDNEFLNNTLISGSHLNAENDLYIDTGALRITSSENFNRYDSDTEEINGSISMTMYGAASGPQIALGYGNNHSDSSSVTQNNATLNANSVTISTTGDTGISGGNIHATDLLSIAVGGNLNVESQKDTYNSSSNNINVSGGFGLGGNGDMANTSFGARTGSGIASANGAFGSGSGRIRTKQTVLSSLTGGKVNIETAGNTHIKGALISSGVYDETASFTDTGNLNLKTDTLTFINSSNTTYSTSESFNFGTNVSFGGETENSRPGPDTNININTSNLGYASSLRNTKTKTLATIGQGNLEIGNPEGSDDLEKLNRDSSAAVKDLYDVNRDIDIDVTLDHRLLSEDGRNEIKEDTKAIEKEIEALKDNAALFTEAFQNAKEAMQLVSDDPAIRKKKAQEVTAYLLPGLNPEKQQRIIDQIGALAESSGEKTVEVLDFIARKQNTEKQHFFPAVIAVVVLLLEAVDKGIIAYDAYQIAKAVDEKDYGKAGSLAGEYGLEMAVESTIGNVVPGSMLIAKGVKTAKDVVVDAPKKAYKPIRKHQKGGWGTEMDIDDSTAQKVLDEAIPGGKQQYGLHDGKVYEFQPDNTGGWHGYPVPGNKAPPSVLKQMLKEDRITKNQYKKLLKGKQ